MSIAFVNRNLTPFFEAAEFSPVQARNTTYFASHDGRYVVVVKACALRAGYFFAQLKSEKTWAVYQTTDQYAMRDFESLFAELNAGLMKREYPAAIVYHRHRMLNLLIS